MDEQFGAAMRRALQAVRSGEVSEATTIVQQALGAVRRSLPVRFDRMRLPLNEAVQTLREAPPMLPEPEPAPEPRVVEGAAFLEAVHVEAAGSRRYRLYRPASLMGDPPDGLVLMLHGCGQTPEDFAAGTRMNALAETHRLVVVYPEQTRAHNGRSCWNWFRPGDQQRGAGEPAILAGLAGRVAADFAVPEGRVFVAGLSAGGGMAAVLGAAYPDVFAAVAVHSGPPHGSANDVLSALAVMRGERGPGAGPTDLAMPLIVFQGDADTTVHPSNAVRLVGPAPGSEVRGAAGGRDFTRRALQGQGGAAVELWMVEGAGHAWSGGDPAGSFADAAGPDASAEIVRFFLETGRA